MPFHWFVVRSPSIDVLKGASPGVMRYVPTVGWGNGYVVIPPDHPYATGIPVPAHIDCVVDVHGGVTFGPEIVDYVLLEDERFKPHLSAELWQHTVYGFYTSHLGDNLTNWSKFNVKIETLRLLKQMEEIYAKAKSNPDL